MALSQGSDAPQAISAGFAGVTGSVDPPMERRYQCDEQAMREMERIDE
ncbi:MAG: hypothetical protein P8J20_00195 [Novosphingobium sp.]|nr:hypothetical protein [Novosphingobium sp.]